MSTSAGVLSAEDFEKVAATCSRWHPRSLAVARALLVDGLKPGAVAAREEMSPQQVSIIRKRFEDRVSLAGILKVSAEEFMADEAPNSEGVLDAFKSEIQKLSRASYSTSQILSYLHRNGVEIDENTLSDYLGKVMKNANSRSRKS